MLTTTEKATFDKMNNTSYLFRVMLEKNGFEIQPITINNDIIYHLLRNCHTIGTIVTRHEDETNYTYTNVRLYKYFAQKFSKADNFIMSEYWIKEDGVIVKFNFDKFEKWCNNIKQYADSMGTRSSDKDNVKTINDVLNRLIELVDEYDEKFTSNVLIKDIRSLLNENERLTNELKLKNDKIFKLFLKI